MYTVSSPPMHSNENDTIASNDLQWRKNYRIYVCVCVCTRAHAAYHCRLAQCS